MIGNPDTYYGATASEYDAKRDGSPMRNAERSAVSRLINSGPVFDAPVGTGGFCDLYRRYGGMGVDSSSEMLSICTRKHPWMDTDIVDLKAPLPYPDRHWPVTLCMRFVWWLKDGEFQSVMSELRRVSRAVVYSVRVSEKYGPGLNHKSLAHTPAMVFEANGGWRVTHCIDVTRNYRVLRIEP